MTCSDVRRIFKSPKKRKNSEPESIPSMLLNELTEEISFTGKKHVKLLGSFAGSLHATCKVDNQKIGCDSFARVTPN